MHGFFGKALLVDVTEQTSKEIPLSDDLFRKVLGGKGLATCLLKQFNPPHVDAFSPDNHIIFAVGPAADTGLYGSARYGVFTKSPQTTLYSESYSGGSVAIALSRTGYDAVVVRGASPHPIALYITEGKVEFRDAARLWGRDTRGTEIAVKRGAGRGAAALVIGPAGESLVKFSVIQSRFHSAGRTGAGAVLGSKRIKAICFHGNKKREVADRAGVNAIRREFLRRAKEMPDRDLYSKFGTPLLVSIVNTMGGFPTGYWQEGTLEGWENLTAESLAEKCDIRAFACPSCFLACRKTSTVKQGKYAGLMVEGPEYETIYAFGGLCRIPSIEEVLHLNALCNSYGLDTMTTGNLVGFTIEAVKRGKVQFEIDYGDVAGVERLITMIARKEGIGAVLAEGIRSAAQTWGLEDLAVHVKGLEPAGFEPRMFKGMALSYAVSPRGACHMRTGFFKEELSGTVYTDEEMVRKLVLDEDELLLYDALILCRFYRSFLGLEEMGRLVEGLTGMKLGREDLLKIGRTLGDLVRAFNVREGLTPRDDRLPKRFFKERAGMAKPINEGEMERLVEMYYEMRGWGPDGIPRRTEGEDVVCE